MIDEPNVMRAIGEGLDGGAGEGEALGIGVREIEEGLAIESRAKVCDLLGVFDGDGDGVGRVGGGDGGDFGDDAGDFFSSKITDLDGDFLLILDAGNEVGRNSDFEIHAEVPLDRDDGGASGDDLIDVGWDLGNDAIVGHDEVGVFYGEFSGGELGFSGFLASDGGVEIGLAGVAGFEKLLGAAKLLDRLEGLSFGDSEVSVRVRGIELGKDGVFGITAAFLGDDGIDTAGEFEAEVDRAGRFGFAGEAAEGFARGFGDLVSEDRAGLRGRGFFVGVTAEEEERKKEEGRFIS